jgi:uncharacterized protein
MPPKPEKGCRIEVRVTPRSSRNKLELTSDGSLNVWTTAPPTDGQANAAVCEIVAKSLGIAKSAVSVIRGDTSRQKLLAIDGKSIDDVRTKLASL